LTNISSGNSIKTNAYVFLFSGLGLFIVLIGYYGVADVAAALAVAGWGLIWVALFHLVVLVLLTVGWQALLDKEESLAFKTLLWVRWVGESIKGLLPVAQVGGDLVKARLAKHRGLPGDVAGASIVVDLTVSVVTQIIFTAIGLGLLLGSGAPKIIFPILISLGIMGFLVTCFYIVQRRGLFGGIAGALDRFTGNRGLHSFVGGAAALDAAINRIYRNRSAVLYCSFYRLFGWIVGTGEVWLALYFLDVPTKLGNALLLESLGQAVRSAAFLIPGAMGVQEGGFLLLGGLVGLSPEVALALSLTKRVRVLLLGIPGLISWQVSEGRRLRRLRHGPA
jgi:putative membrane protein